MTYIFLFLNKFLENMNLPCLNFWDALLFSACRKLTTKSVRAIGANCPNLRLLDLQRLNQLNDLALKYLANGCRSMTTLKLRQNLFRLLSYFLFNLFLDGISFKKFNLWKLIAYLVITKNYIPQQKELVH